MSTVSIPDLLKAAERPLALFLEDALRHVDPNYWETIVKPYVASRMYPAGDVAREYSGTESLIDNRGQAKTSLQQCDLLFLTHLLEWCTMQKHRKLHPTLRYVDLTDALPFTKKSIRSKIIAVRDMRNAWSHEEKHTSDRQHQFIDLSKLLDLFRVELLHIAQSSDQFSAETQEVLQAFVDRISEGQSQLAVPDTVQVHAPTQRPRFLIAAVALSAVIVTVMVLIRPTIEDALVLTMFEPLPASKEEEFVKVLSQLPYATERTWQVHVIDGPGSPRIVNTTLTDEQIKMKLIPMLSRAQGLKTIDDFGPRLDTSIAAMEAAMKDSIAPLLFMIGHMPVLTRMDSLARAGQGVVVLHKTSWWFKRWRDYGWEAPTFIYFRKPQGLDDAVFRYYSDNAVEGQKPRRKDL